MRPVPANSRLVTLLEAQKSRRRYYCIVTHNITDLLDIKYRPEPRLMVIHSTLEGRALEEKSDIEPKRMKELLHQYVEMAGVHIVAVSALKGGSWGFTGDIVPLAVDKDDYLSYSGQVAMGLRICNFIDSRKKILLWDFHGKAFDGVPVRLVGHNPNMPGVAAAKDWNDLKKMLQSYRFYVHTAALELEDGYNTASLEAMAAGMPILGNLHPGSPVEHGVSGFLSDNPEELRKYAGILLDNRGLAVEMGRQAQKTVIERFSMSRFKEGFLRSIETARRKCESREVETGKI
jgi:glycosyltransferase involved in cell wall biosynthesis